jgi:hypothetical protein
MTRQSKFLWMKDLLEHMQSCHEQWETADERRERMLAETMRRDLEEIRRLCDSLLCEARPDDVDRSNPSAPHNTTTAPRPRLYRWAA